jgi:hypothetical protein
MSSKLIGFYAAGLSILKEGMSGFDEPCLPKEDMAVFYWTDSVTGKGVKVFVETKAERTEILLHYFEASIGPLEGVRYNAAPVSWSGVISSRRVG